MSAIARLRLQLRQAHSEAESLVELAVSSLSLPRVLAEIDGIAKQLSDAQRRTSGTGVRNAGIWAQMSSCHCTRRPQQRRPPN